MIEIAFSTLFIDLLKTLLSSSSGNVLGISRAIYETFVENLLQSFEKSICLFFRRNYDIRTSYGQATILIEEGIPLRTLDRSFSSL